MFVNFH